MGRARRDLATAPARGGGLTMLQVFCLSITATTGFPSGGPPP
jgi:hypothetical protein